MTQKLVQRSRPSLTLTVHIRIVYLQLYDKAFTLENKVQCFREDCMEFFKTLWIFNSALRSLHHQPAQQCCSQEPHIVAWERFPWFSHVLSRARCTLLTYVLKLINGYLFVINSINIPTAFDPSLVAVARKIEEIVSYAIRYIFWIQNVYRTCSF